MKTKIIIIISILFISVGLNAQIDRSKQPEPKPASKIQLQKPVEFTLSNGLKVMVVENHKLPRVSYNLTIDNTPSVEGEIKGVSNLLASLLGNGTTSITKDDFNEEVDFLGANLSFSASGAFASGLSKYSERILQLMADAAINPLFDDAEFNKKKDLQIDGLKTGEKSVDVVAGRMALALAYGTHHPSGEFITEESLKNVSLEDVKIYYQNSFNPKNGYLVIIGDVELNKIKQQVQDYFGSWITDSAFELKMPAESPNTQYTQINFVDMPNAVQSNISVMNNTKLKMSDPDFHATLIANQILGGGATGYLFKNLRVAHGYTYGSYSGINPSKYVSRFRANAKVRNMVTDSSITEILKEIKRIRTEDVDAKVLADVKASYVGSFVRALERPQTMAQYALNIKINDLPEDFYTNYLEKINNVTVEDVKRAANKHFKLNNSRIVVVGKGSDVLENLEKIGIPIKYFDKYANPVDKPEFTKPIPEGVTAQSVIENYITAIGGKDKAMAVNTMHSISDVTIEGAPFSPKVVIKQMMPNKESLEMSIEDMGVIMKQKFNGESGYMEQQGQRKETEGEMLTEQKNKKVMFPELYYDDTFNVSLESLTTIDGNDVYKIRIEKNSKETFKYYNAETGLLTRVEKTEKKGETETTTLVDYSKYSPVDGVKFPYYTMIKTGPQTIIFNTTKVTVNEGVSDADFN